MSLLSLVAFDAASSPPASVNTTGRQPGQSAAQRTRQGRVLGEHLGQQPGALADRRLNLVNPRREFFFATPAEVRDLLLARTGGMLEFTDQPEALEYLQSRNSWPPGHDSTDAHDAAAPIPTGQDGNG